MQLGQAGVDILTQLAHLKTTSFAFRNMIDVQIIEFRGCTFLRVVQSGHVRRCCFLSIGKAPHIGLDAINLVDELVAVTAVDLAVDFIHLVADLLGAAPDSG